MATLTPVDYDPFAQPAAQPKAPRLTPVDYDPFATPQPRTRSYGDETGRQLGLTARYALEGVGDALGVLSDPIALAIPGANMRAGELATYAADKLGLPNPEGGVERVVAGASRGVAGAAPFLGAGQLVAKAPGLIGAAGQALAAAPAGQGTAAAAGGGSAQLAAEMGAGPGGQAAAGLAGALAPAGAAAGLRGLARGGEAGRQNMLATIDQFERSGAGVPTLGQATEGRVARGAEALLGRAPGGAGVIARTGERQQEGMGTRVRQVADSMSAKASPEQAGRGIERGIIGPGGFMSEFRRAASDLYGKVDQFIPPATRIPVARTKATLDQLASPTPGAEQTSRALASGKIADLQGALDADLQASIAAAGRGELPYEAVKALRSRLGELIADSTFATDVPTKQLKAVYGALSEDMSAAVRATNNPDAIRAVTRANNFYRAGMNRMQEIERVVERNGGPERIFAAATSGTREGATTLRAVMQSLPSDAKKQLSAAVLRRMGRAKPGQQDDLGEAFSSETFLTNWNGLAPEAKTTLFGRFGPTYVRDVEAIAKSAGNIREGAQVFRNPSGTGQAATQIGTAVSLAAAVGTGNTQLAGYILAAVAAANGAARVMSSPRAVRWLAQQTKAPVAALPVQLARLKAEALAEGDDEALEIAKAIEASVSE